MNRSSKIIIFACLLLSISSFGQKKGKAHYLTKTLSATEIKNLDTKLEKVYYMLAGHFSNKSQADTSTSGLFKEQEIICVPMWKKRAGEYWLYMSWYPGNNIESPMSQFVYRLDKFARDTFTLERFNLPQSMRGTIWADAKALDKFKPADLISTGCVNYIVSKGSEEFYSQPRKEDEYCPEVAGSPFAFLQMESLLTPEHVILYGTFYDNAKKVLFTQKPGGVYFTRSDKDNPKYMEELYPSKKKK